MHRVVEIRLAFSPDADDLFMFWPLLAGRVALDDLPAARGLSFVHERVDTESLNARASAEDPPHVCAVSVAHLAAIADRYLLLPHGGSVGRKYGPVVVAKRALSLADLAGLRVAVPGLRTTAYTVLHLLVDAATHGGRFTPVVVPIAPFSRAFESIASGETDAALLIHEGRLTWSDDPSLHLVTELGEQWHAMTGLPLPLGANAIRRDLGEERIAAVSEACRRSIRWALTHRDEVLDAIASSGARDEAKLDRARLDRYLAMYANEDSAAWAPDALEALRVLLARGHAAGLLPAGRVDVAP
jgi:1,4-dihydroxy-6-naphthoate synthase